MTSIILDTHYFYWYINQTPKKVSANLQNQINRADDVYLSAISCFEMAMLVKYKRIVFDMPYTQWYDIAIAQSGIQVLPVIADIAHLSVTLPEHHKDPHDRLIIATALYHGYQLASADSKFALYSELQGLLIR